MSVPWVTLVALVSATPLPRGSSQEEQLTIIHGQDTTEKMLEHESAAEVPPNITETKTDHSRKVRGAATLRPRGPIPQASTAPQ